MLLPLPEFFARLDDALPAPSAKVIRHVLKREREPARALWLSKAWNRLEPKDFQADSDPCVVVLEKPVVTKGALVLSANQFGGLFARRDTAVFIFLGAVSCHDFCTVPGTLAILDGGLTVKRLASFDGGDAHTDVRGHLEAPYIISGLGHGWVELAPKTKATIGAYARYIKGLAKGAKGKKHQTVAELLPFAHDELVDQAPWEWAVTFLEQGRAFPRIAVPKKR